MKKLVKIAAFLTVLLAALVIGLIYIVYFIPSSHRRVVMEIPRGLGLKDIALKLEKERVVRDDRLFVLYVFLQDYENELKAGEYEFQAGISLPQIVDKFIRGDVIVRRITIPEGFTLNQIADLLEQNNVISGEAFLRKAYDSEFAIKLLGDSVSGFEGYLFPDTYSYTKGVTSEELIRVMVSRFDKVYESLKSEADGKLSLTDHEIITLASIVEKETGDASERPLISAVFHNRLRRGMRLDSDPTVIYGLGEDFDGNLTKSDLRTETGYNTYKIAGLPPGPIANPGKASIRATMNPAEVDYLYFVSRGDGTHVFSSNYRDHQRAVIRYQKRHN